jgi:hypothetical protein
VEEYGKSQRGHRWHEKKRKLKNKGETTVQNLKVKLYTIITHPKITLNQVKARSLKVSLVYL